MEFIGTRVTHKILFLEFLELFESECITWYSVLYLKDMIIKQLSMIPEGKKKVSQHNLARW